MGRDNELRIALDEAVHRGQQSQLTGRRQRGLRFVKQIHSVAAEPMEHERQERLPVRLRMQDAATVLIGIPGVCRRRHVIERLGPQEIRIRGRVPALGEDQRAEQLRMRGSRREPLVLGAAFRIQSKRYGDSFEQRGFPGAVLSDEKRYGCFKPQLGEMANGGDGVGIVLRRGAEHALAGNGLDEDVGNRGRQLGTVFLHLSSATGLISATLGGVILCYLEKDPTRQVD